MVWRSFYVILLSFLLGISTITFSNTNYLKSNLNLDSTTIDLQSDDFMIAGNIGTDDYLRGMELDHEENVIIYGRVAEKFGFFRYKQGSPLNSTDRAIWGDGSPMDLVVDSLGNIFIAGFNNSGICLIKYNKNLEFQWNKTFGIGSLCYDMIIDSNNNIFIVGGPPFHVGTLFLYKYDQNGNEIWKYNVTNADSSIYDMNYEILSKDSNENIFMVYEQFERFIEGYIDGPILRILKFSNSGTVLLNFTYIPLDYLNNVLSLRKIIVDDFDNLYILGRKFFSSNLEFQILKYDNMGISQWNKSYEFLGEGNYYNCKMKLDLEGNLYLLEKKKYAALAKINPSSGNLLWQTPNENSNEWANSMAFDTMNNVYIVGGVLESDRNVLLIKYDTNGNFIGKKTWDRYGNETGLDIVINSHDDIFIAGRTDGFFSTDYDLFLQIVEPIVEPIDGLNWPLVIGVGVGAIALVSIGIFVFLRKKHKKP